MHLDESESDLLKKWVIKKLEDISDADSDVLADYVLALVRTDDPAPVAQKNVVENLQDFLGNNTAPFVQEVFQAISTKSYDPNRPPPKPTAPLYHPPKRQSFEQSGFPNESRKRSYHDWDREEDTNGQIRSYQGAERPMKHARRGGRGFDPRAGRQSFPSAYQYGISPQPMPHMPIPPPGMPPLDPNNPMAALLAMQEAMSMLSGMPNGPSPPNGNLWGPSPTRQRCTDYDTKGFCAAGASCPYEHGEDPLVIPRIGHEYDPNNATLLNITPSRVGHVNTSYRDRGRGGRRGLDNWRGGGKRSNFALLGPSRDSSNTSIVVEQIPQDQCDEKSIRRFFEEFGVIEELTVYPDRRLAIIRYDSHEAAKSAYESPKVVFDNRFVKIYWHKAIEPADPPMEPFNPSRVKLEAEDDEMQDTEPDSLHGLTKRQEDAQRKHEEAKKRREEHEKQKQDIDVKLKAMELERKKIADSIAEKTGKASSPVDDSPTQIKTEESENTKALKAQLAKLEDEAKSLGLDPYAATNGYSGYSSYRGRGGYRGRGRGRASYRGYRGGWAPGARNGGAVMRLDNRPKTVAVTFGEGSYDDHDEAIRQLLLFNGLNSATLAKHQERDNTALVTFNHRYEGENFMDAAGNSELPHVGKVELSWYKSDENTISTNGTHDMKLKMETAEDAEDAEQSSSAVQVVDGYDMADEEDLDRWT